MAPSKITKPFPLLHLPLELRNDIYKQTLAAGTTNLLLTSKQIHAEASRFIYTSASLRFSNSSLFGPLKTPAFFATINTNIIPNIEINIYFHTVTQNNALVYPMPCRHLRPFLGRKPHPQPRETCKVNLTEIPRSQETMAHLSWILRALDSFVDFKTLFVAVQQEAGPMVPVAVNGADCRRYDLQKLFETTKERFAIQNGIPTEHRVHWLDVPFLEYHPRHHHRDGISADFNITLNKWDGGGMAGGY